MGFFQRGFKNRETLIGFTKHLERLAHGFFVSHANVHEPIRCYSDVIRDLERRRDLFRCNSPSTQCRKKCVRRIDGFIPTQIGSRGMEGQILGRRTPQNSVVADIPGLRSRPRSCGFCQARPIGIWPHSVAAQVLVARRHPLAAHLLQQLGKASIHLQLLNLAPGNQCGPHRHSKAPAAGGATCAGWRRPRGDVPAPGKTHILTTVQGRQRAFHPQGQHCPQAPGQFRQVRLQLGVHLQGRGSTNVHTRGLRWW